MSIHEIPVHLEEPLNYHVPFSGKAYLPSIGVGILACAALVVGILATLHAQHIVHALPGPLNAIPSSWAYGIGGTGGLLALGSSLAAIIIAVKNKAVSGPLSKHLTNENIYNWNQKLRTLGNNNHIIYPRGGNNPPYVVLQSDSDGNRSVHLFATQAETARYANSLESSYEFMD